MHNTRVSIYSTYIPTFVRIVSNWKKSNIQGLSGDSFTVEILMGSCIRVINVFSVSFLGVKFQQEDRISPFFVLFRPKEEFFVWVNLLTSPN